MGGSLLLIAGYRALLVALVLALFSVATALTFHTAFGAGNLSLDARAGRA